MPHDAAFLYIGSDELERARQRVSEPGWRAAADALKESAERVLARDRDLPDFDSAWYDADPDRDFGQTYVLFHDYMRPATRLMSGAHTLLIAGQVFQEDRYLDTAKAWASHMAAHGRFHVQHHDAGMSYAGMADPLAEIYRVLFDRFSTEEQAQLRAALIACGEAIWTNSRHWAANLARMPYNNHLACHARGLLVLGLALDRSEWIGPVLDGPKGFGRLMAGATYDDGLCYESSTGYHFATLHFLMRVAELVRHRPDMGRDLYRESFANGRTLKHMFDAPLGLLLPNGELPALGDCYAARAPLWRRSAAVYELAYAVYGDPHYAWLIRQGDERASLNALLYGADDLSPAEPVACRSRLWVEHGYGLIACPDDSPTVAAVLTGDRSGVHNHRDALGLQIFADGRLWTEDAESRAVAAHSFSDPIQQVFNRTMLAHNLVVVDEQDQRGIRTPLQVTQFAVLPSCHTVEMADDGGRLSPGVWRQRSVAVTPDYCLDVYQVASEADHTYDWLVHPRADGRATCDLAFGDTSLPDRAPYAVLREAQIASTPKEGIALTWNQETDRFRIDVSAGMEGRLFRALWPVAGDWSEGGREVFMYRVQADRADFVSLGQVITDDAPWRIASAERVFNGAHDEIRVSVARGNEVREHVFAGM